MSAAQIINKALLNSVTETAKESPRKRKNYNFHGADTEASHRLLNAMEPDSYIPPHCHAEASKDETIVVLRGKFGVVFFDEVGNVTQTALLAANGESVGVNIPHGVFHTLLALEPSSVFFESKAGPYLALTAMEKVSWAPQEGEEGVAQYLVNMKKLFR